MFIGCALHTVFQSTGGQDGIMRIWVLKSCHKYFEDIRRKYGDGN